ncbi:MAG: germination protein YpeB [Bacillaceae bacterium]|jgi:germination protein YpeB|uniref:Germination protein YpeB n=1 Tax=Aeribacillus composti TaxID=1868734 RepID=A0ABY9W747_9BACI|nr:germination protein YpeB [Aeribacillus composti]MDR9795596.1 germination protein YpeB [Aeribacillus pallidus]REJ17396.1 MAG: germination protein YpeB [Bacillaceae bacterium]MED0715881.1 germination protein YpeB [Aeribacillus composti]MED0745574.1 germination protein YpeB [Aeribacillus composti]MED1441530.1 germination protein YpeB [Aeribacillus composti]
MLRGLLIGLLTVALIGTGYWGYKEHQEKNAVLIHAENNYQRAFHDLTYQVDLLHDKIGETLAMNSRKSLSPALAEVWRITSEAHNDVGQLPLTLLPFNKTEEFLSNIGKFSYQTAVRDLNKDPLTDQEYETLKKLYKNAKDIQDELRNVQHLILKNNLRWMDVELALASGQKQMDNTIIDGFKTVEKNVEGYSETNFGPTATALQKPKKGFEQLTGKEISEQEAKQIAKRFAPKNVERVDVTTNGKGSNIQFYSITMHDKGNKHDVYMDITKKGGHLIYLLHNRDIKQQKISLNEASNRATEFLKKLKFKDLELYESAQYDNIGVFTFVSNYKGVRLYPDAVRLKVALDNGEIIGYSGRDYLAAHKKRNLPKPAITKEEAKKSVHSNVEIQEDRLAVVTNDAGEEVLCYEFLGTIDQDTYRIFINAMDGTEEKVEKLQSAEPLFREI